MVKALGIEGLSRLGVSFLGPHNGEPTIIFYTGVPSFKASTVYKFASRSPVICN